MKIKKSFPDALRYALAVNMCKMFWAEYNRINPNKEYGGETDEAFTDKSEPPVFEDLFEGA